MEIIWFNLSLMVNFIIKYLYLPEYETKKGGSVGKYRQ